MKMKKQIYYMLQVTGLPLKTSIEQIKAIVGQKVKVLIVDNMLYVFSLVEKIKTKLQTNFPNAQYQYVPSNKNLFQQAIVEQPIINLSHFFLENPGLQLCKLSVRSVPEQSNNLLTAYKFCSSILDILKLSQHKIVLLNKKFDYYDQLHAQLQSNSLLFDIAKTKKPFIRRSDKSIIIKAFVSTKDIFTAVNLIQQLDKVPGCLFEVCGEQSDISNNVESIADESSENDEASDRNTDYRAALGQIPIQLKDIVEKAMSCSGARLADLYYHEFEGILSNRAQIKAQFEKQVASRKISENWMRAPEKIIQLENIFGLLSDKVKMYLLLGDAIIISEFARICSSLLGLQFANEPEARVFYSIWWLKLQLVNPFGLNVIPNAIASENTNVKGYVANSFYDYVIARFELRDEDEVISPCIIAKKKDE